MPKPTYTRQNVGAALRKVRIEKGLKQAYVAMKAGTSKELISKMENGKCDFRMCRLNQLLQIYDCTPIDFWNLFDYSGFFNLEPWVMAD
ncbi:Helix-turn-helix domain-containing protein [Filimonas lacunae]|uniref:Helix-turn-helix domain-containing protein n=1 Tax=Filimonas lacunae TaxID=477680 RepID=A0A173MQU7_9BACT|nr:helix-turn-helix transcriptional regulator [Filimonas lacunae]BAV09820.1 hypothetical protein FLA_5873 [Filimonas lacunae]SIS79431.1 Helix-turn-helix domain-containing protein [Filimonas lacunae]